MTLWQDFTSDDRGAINVDWVALTGSLLLLGLMVIYAIYNNGVSSLVSSVGETASGSHFDVAIGTAENQNQ